MNRRPFFLLEVFVLIVLLILGLTPSMPSSEKDAAKVCAFCNPEVIKRQQIWEGHQVRVLYNYKPLFRGHTLIIPKRHVERLEDLTDDEVVEIHQTIRKVHKAFQQVYGANDYVLILQNGANAGQTVPHVHFHMLPRADKNVFQKVYIWWAMLTRPLSLLIALDEKELQTEIAPLRQAMLSGDS